jgi:pimeloyl-ACP methyl ester carboxylesterase
MPTIFVKVLTLASFFFVFIIFVSLLGVYSATHPRKRGVDITPESLGMGYENISFQTRDGLTLRGWFIPSKTNRTIVVLHGYPFNKGNILDFAKFLHPLFQLFLFDFRAMGESDGKIATGGLKEQDDLKSALAFLRARKDVGEIGVYGFSYGASIALLAAPQEKGIKAIVADSGFSSQKLLLRKEWGR